jgi:cobyrinic acid a,c-diamide synthase
MSRYIIMTVDGLFGGTITAANDTDAELQAALLGEEVVEVIDAVGMADDVADFILVVPS